MVGQELRYTAAHSQARQNFNRNLDALRARQRSLADDLSPSEPDVEWVYGRDGVLTARRGAEWLSGNSLPLKSAHSMLVRLELGAPVACFLNPTHATQLRVALERMTLAQSLIAIVADVEELRLVLGCEDFESEIAAGRLWFVVGTQWPAQLASLFVENEGLPTPGQFIRTGLTPAEALDGMIATAQEIFSKENARRAQRVNEINADAGSRTGICVVVGSLFRLWDDAGQVLTQMAVGNGWSLLNVDEPTTSSAVALARKTAASRAVIVVNAGRAQLPGISQACRVITWLTTPRIPAYHPGDGLLVAHPSWKDAALEAGWPADRVEVAAWPAQTRRGKGQYLALIADTSSLATPPFDLSSHRVLWEMIASELDQNPFACGINLARYLAARIHRAGIAPETIDQNRFIDRLIVPAHQQSLARQLAKARIDLRLFGHGWEQIPDLGRFARGPVSTREDLAALLDGAAALLHAWPGAIGHPVESCGRPLVIAQNVAQAIEQSMQAVTGKTQSAPPAPSITSQAIQRLLA